MNSINLDIKSKVNSIRKDISDKVDNINLNTNDHELGVVTKVQEFIVEISGINNAGFFDLIKIKDKAIGYVTSIKSNSIYVAITKEFNKIAVGDKAESTGKEYKAKFSPDSFGHIIDIFGTDLLNDKMFDNSYDIKIENENVPILDRTPVKRPLYTGIAGIDLLYPIGKGQRQLIIGDKQTGKTQICLDTIVAQKNTGLLSIYVAIGKTKKEIKNIYMELSKRNAIKNTIIIAATNDQKTPVLSLTPYVALSIAESFMMLRQDVLVVIDDLKRHADSYREIGLLSGKAPGREVYPSDIFYKHSSLLEKGCQHYEGGSITILPIVETKDGDISSYISTNIISITDGQVVLSRKNFDKGQKPAIEYGLSVSRLGGAVQEDHIKKLGTKVRRELLSYLETKDIYELTNTEEMSPELQNKLKLGKQTYNKFNQYKFENISSNELIELFRSSYTD